MRRALLMFVKAPVPGRVKTRLQPPLTPEEAAGLYEAMVEDLIEALVDNDDWDLTVMFDPPTEESSFRSWLGGGVALVPQSGDDLGGRLRAAFLWADHRGYDRTVIIGSDMPELQTPHIGAAFEQLADADVVLGPSRDGGYYLVGLKQPEPEIFTGIDWSTHRVIDQTVSRIEAAGMTRSHLPERTDVDTWNDAIELHSGLVEGDEAAPRTRAMLAVLMGKHSPEDGND